MHTHTHRAIVVSVFTLTVLFGVLYTFVFAHAKEKNAPQAIVCTEEVKLCPDGSFVGRTGPNCSFAPCPDATIATGTADITNYPVDIEERKTMWRLYHKERVKAMRAAMERASTTKDDTMSPVSTSGAEKGNNRPIQEYSQHIKETYKRLVESRQARWDMLDREREAKKEALMQQMEQRKNAMAERKSFFAKEAQTHLTLYITRTSERMKAVAEHLQNVADRILRQIEKVETQHAVDLQEARIAITHARTLLNETFSNITLFEEVAKNILASDDPRAYRTQIHDAAEVVEDSLKEVHDALRDAVVNIRAAVEASSVRASASDSEKTNNEESSTN